MIPNERRPRLQLKRRVLGCSDMDSEKSLPRWHKRLNKELVFRPEFDQLTKDRWRALLKTRRVTSSNHDTVLSLDWPHFCGSATPACGGPRGWCYTFQGNQASVHHDRHAAMVDVLARKFPELFAEKVEEEVRQVVAEGLIKYPNLRYSGSGELVEAHLPALEMIKLRDVRLWGFTRDLRIAERLRKIGIAVIVSCDKTSSPGFVETASAAGFLLAYSSSGVDDAPPARTVVTFPVHRVGRVKEVVDATTICPKVLADFLDDARQQSTCQLVCNRCHNPRVC
jgi:hypothetical protein